MSLLGDGANALLVVLGFGLLIAVHEFGHFIAAKWAQVRVDGFAIGMGPVVVSYRKGLGVRLGSTTPAVAKLTGKPAIQLSPSELERYGIGETEYSLRLLPLGGFVRMLGQDDLDPLSNSTDPRSYTRVAIWKRMIIVSAGVTCNLILAIALFVVAFLIGVRFDAPVVGGVVPGEPADKAGIRAGDTVLSIDGSQVSTFADLQIAAAMSRPDIPLLVSLHRPGAASGEPIQIEVWPQQSAIAGMRTMGVAPASSTTLIDEPDAMPFLYGALVRSGFWNRSGSSGAPTIAQFEESFKGATLESIAGVPATTYGALEAAARKSDGSAIPTQWAIADGSMVDIALACAPQWQILEYTDKPADAVIDYEHGLLGLAPLVKIGRVAAGSAAAGVVEEGDVILKAGDFNGPRQMEFRLALHGHAGATIPLRVLRAGKEIDCVARVGRDGRLGVEIASAWETPIIARPFVRVGESPGVDTPVAQLNLMPLSRIDSVEGVAVADWNAMFRLIQTYASANPNLTNLHIAFTPPTPGATSENMVVAIDAHARTQLGQLQWRSSLGPEWFRPAEVVLCANSDPIRAAAMGFSETHKMVLMTYLTLDRLFRGTVGVSQLRGPVGIVHIGTRVASRGLTYIVFFLAMISVNLAVINFLPIPIADGGLMVFLIYEKLRGKPPSPAFQNGAMLAGLVLVGLLFAVTFYNDVMRLVG